MKRILMLSFLLVIFYALCAQNDTLKLSRIFFEIGGNNIPKTSKYKDEYIQNLNKFNLAPAIAMGYRLPIKNTKVVFYFKSEFSRYKLQNEVLRLTSRNATGSWQYSISKETNNILSVRHSLKLAFRLKQQSNASELSIGIIQNIEYLYTVSAPHINITVLSFIPFLGSNIQVYPFYSTLCPQASIILPVITTKHMIIRFNQQIAYLPGYSVAGFKYSPFLMHSGIIIHLNKHEK